jgi:CheY-like chemotaxis protein
LARKILLADDSVTAQNMGRKILADAGYDVLTVNNGSAALKKVGEHKPDLIVLDVYMPGYSGLEVCQRLKDIGETARIPILLTVGKLEPFKPEEAKRVHADGFIVKPFEASELLAALSKLEDKVVPAPEPAKPGRFARVAASIEERSPKTAFPESTSSWKKRVPFPPETWDKPKTERKTEQPKPEEANADDSAIYNAVNRDFRTIVDRTVTDTKRGEKAQARNNSHRVDPSVLANSEVTSEEIGALAAAAAQMRTKNSESRTAAETIEEVKPEAAASEPATLSGHPEVLTGTGKDFQSQLQNEIREVQPPESPDEKRDTFALDQASQAATPVAEAQNSTLESQVADAAHHPIPESDDPVTLAVATPNAQIATASRWTAVSVALDTHEGALSLEQEMQKAQAANSNGGNANATVGAEPASPGGLPANDSAVTAEAVVQHEDQASLKAIAPEPIQGSVEPASVAPAHVPDEVVISPAQLEQQSSASLGSSLPEQSAPSAASTAEPTQTFGMSNEIQAADVAVELKREPELTAVAQSPLESRGQESQTGASPNEEFEQNVATRVHVTDVHANPVQTEAQSEVHTEVQAGIPTDIPTDVQPVPEVRVEARAAAGPASTAEFAVTAQPVTVTEQPAIEQIVTEPTVAEPTQGSGHESSKTEADFAATTAAAWASWRKIRESGDGKAKPSADSSNPGSSKPGSSNLGSSRPDLSGQDSVEMPVLQDAAAMAAAAGAQDYPGNHAPGDDAPRHDTPGHSLSPDQSPDPSSNRSSDTGAEAIASIVDSILADMRPKILEELTRKLRNKQP